MTEKEFKVNEHIVLKLEDGKTNIYIGGTFFLLCKSLFIINPHENEKQWEINSIDEAAELLNSDLKKNITPEDLGLTPEEEFWGHCSNLQAWAEHDYNTRLLHSNLAFPLLGTLANEGDQIAKKYFKEEIAKRLESGDDKVKGYLIGEGYIEYLEHEELLRSILKDDDYKLILEIESIFKGEDDFLHFEPLELAHEDTINPGFRTKEREIIEIHFNSTKLKQFPEALTRLGTLEKLNLASCGLNDIPESIKNLKKLEVLNLAFNELKEIPVAITELPSLQELNLSHNWIRDLPDSLKNLKSLRKLGLNNNHFESINDILGELGNLEEVSIFNNDNLQELPEIIGNLKLDKTRMYYDKKEKI